MVLLFGPQEGLKAVMLSSGQLAIGLVSDSSLLLGSWRVSLAG